MKALNPKINKETNKLELVEIDKPTISDEEILVEVRATAVTPTDVVSVKGDNPIVKVIEFLTSPFTSAKAAGDVFAGDVVQVGEKVKDFTIGDKVFGTLAPNTGTHAEFVKIRENKVVTKIPENLSYQEAATLVDGPLTANAFLTKIGKATAGQKILINGASGSVGSASVQLAKHFGLEVTGVCSTKNLKLVTRLGADTVIDYTKVDFTKMDTKFDLIFDTVGKTSYSETKHMLTEHGMFMATMPSWDIVISFFKTRFSTQKAVMGATGPFWKKSELDLVADLASKRTLVPLIDSEYSFAEFNAAYKKVEEGHKVGSIVMAP